MRLARVTPAMIALGCVSEPSYEGRLCHEFAPCPAHLTCVDEHCLLFVAADASVAPDVDAGEDAHLDSGAEVSEGDGGDAIADGGIDDGGTVDGSTTLLNDPDFDLPFFDSGNLPMQCVVAAPLGDSWGVRAGTSSAAGHLIDNSHFLFSGHDAYVYGLELRGYDGSASIVQGNVWGAGVDDCGAPGAPGWHTFEPVDVDEKQVWLELDIFRDTSMLFTNDASSLEMSIDLSFSSPDLLATGDGIDGRKPLILSFIVHQECTFPSCAVLSEESAVAYHYRTIVAVSPLRTWATTPAVDVTGHLRQAFVAFDLPTAAATTLQLRQIEFVIRPIRAEAAASIDHITLTIE